MTKKCNTCNRDLGVELYNKHPHGVLGLRGSCKECENIKRKHHYNKEDVKARKIEWEREYRKSPEYAQRKFGYRIKAKYNLSLEEYDDICEKQGGVCAICGEFNINGNRLVIDHDHQTGKVRGLLCGSCNCGIGYLKESATIMKKAMKYIKENK